MKRFIIFSALFLCVFGIMAMSPAPTGNGYGGSIFIKNMSSYNLYLEFEYGNNQFGGFSRKQFCIEIQDIILAHHYFHVPFADAGNFDLGIVHPNNYFKKIRMYNMMTGDLLREIDISDEKIFVLINGDINYTHDTIFELVINDPLLAG
ncbi:MAG: hypothetical protein LBQ69_05575 [Treponema sp.]|nr:hypothetical protein [Treponema sp.]